jgi:hypothetical protein
MMPTEEDIPSWMFLTWEDGISTERLLELRIQQLGRLPEHYEIALEKLKAARLNNKERFDKTHKLRAKKIEEGDWVLVFDSTLEHQHSTTRKFARRWFGPYVVVQVHENGTYSLRELDGTLLRIPIAGKRVKAFKRRRNAFNDECINDFIIPQQDFEKDELELVDEDFEDAEEENQDDDEI